MSQAAGVSRDIPSIFQLKQAVPNRLVHLIPDELAEAVPEHALFAYPRTENPEDGIVEISAKRFANAINRTSWYLENLLGKAPEGFPAISYMGSSDIRYFLLMFGAIKAGYKMLYLSPRNTLAGHLNVLEKSDCHIFLAAKNTRIEHILQERTMQSATVPELDELLSDIPVPGYPYTKTFEQARKDPCLVLHTTGSTGLPKPITWKLEILSTYEAWRTIPSINGYISTTEIYQEAGRVYNTMPLFHTSGLNTGITMSLLLGVTTVYGAAGVLPNATYADRMHKHANVEASVGPPSIYEELSYEPESLERISNMRYVLACGAPISQRAGNIISKHTRLISNFGATETAALPRLAPGYDDWAYFYWHPTHSGIELRDYMDGLYELFLVKDPKIDLFQGIFSTFPDIDEYSMNDVYAKHPDPEKGFLYRWVGRADDVIVLSNGEKLAPALMEAGLMSSPLVKGAMVVGRGKFQPAALLDLGDALPKTASERYAIVKEILPAIAEANKYAPAHGKLDQYHILFVDSARPIYYLGQGKIQRHQTYRLYENDIEELYQAMENFEDKLELTEGEVGDLLKVDFGDLPSIKAWLRDTILETAELDGLQDDDSFFEVGMDSLHILRLIREVKFQVKLSQNKKLTPQLLTPGVVYSNPSLSQFSEYLLRKADLAPQPLDSGYQSVDEDEVDGKPKLKYMQSLLEEYTQSLTVPSQPNRAPATGNATVLLTGSTGSLGSYLLNELNNDPKVERIICLDRSSAAEKHSQIGPQRGLATLDPERVEFLKANMADAHLGLGEEVYGRLTETVTHIIHCQWPVNFNWTIYSFKPYITGVRNIANLAAASTHNAFVLFVSSIAAVGGWNGPSSVPEAPIDDLTTAAPTGYGQSKLLAESLLNKAAGISGIRSACCRVGIVAGPIEQKLGMWNKHEYVPSIVVSSAHLGVFPETFPSRDHIDWLPVDKLSKILIEILYSASNPSSNEGLESVEVSETATPAGTKTFHVVNPNTSSWSADLSANLVGAYTGGKVKPVPFEDWLEKLQNSAKEAEINGNVDVDSNPAIRLLEFYTKAVTSPEKGRQLVPTAAAKASQTLRDLGPLKPEWVKTWMTQWGIGEGQNLAA